MQNAKVWFEVTLVFMFRVLHWILLLRQKDETAKCKTNNAKCKSLVRGDFSILHLEVYIGYYYYGRKTKPQNVKRTM
jgi:hypothetical protein